MPVGFADRHIPDLYHARLGTDCQIPMVKAPDISCSEGQKIPGNQRAGGAMSDASPNYCDGSTDRICWIAAAMRMSINALPRSTDDVVGSPTTPVVIGMSAGRT
jgi:hypothetical protein